MAIKFDHSKLGLFIEGSSHKIFDGHIPCIVNFDSSLIFSIVCYIFIKAEEIFEDF